MLGQLAVGIAIGIVVLVYVIATGMNPQSPAYAQQFARAVILPMMISGIGISVVMAYAVTRLWAWDLVRDRTDHGLGVRPVPRRHILISILLGILLCIGCSALSAWLVPFDPSKPLGPLASAAVEGGVSRLVWAVLAVLIAPWLEEYFFRGLLLKGFSTTWGPAGGAIGVTVLFVLLHLFETLHYWPATIAVTLLATVAVCLRLYYRSLAPAVALHAAYNAVIVLTAYSAAGNSPLR
ncbi:MAG TPA: CPBP family intramembrane glutamic endopeptidase [Thermoanaerobaculia bacterium]|nr:CPBP family intramembrane glutamic endopeptidase [Thermoanaerobaculia bacterium]